MKAQWGFFGCLAVVFLGVIFVGVEGFLNQIINTENQRLNVVHSAEIVANQHAIIKHVESSHTENAKLQANDLAIIAMLRRSVDLWTEHTHQSVPKP